MVVLIPEIRVSKAPRYYELLITYQEVGNARPVQADGHKDFRKQSLIVQKVSTPSYTDLTKGGFMDIPKCVATELDTGLSVIGFYYAENGYWMNNGKPDLDQPVVRHYVVDGDGRHRETCETTVKAITGGED